MTMRRAQHLAQSLRRHLVSREPRLCSCAAWPSPPLLITGSAPGTSGTPAIACWKAGSSFNSVKGLFASVGSSGYKK